MQNTDLKLHIAAQYLAAAGKNFVEAKDDDSHTNLGWLEDKRSFISRKFSNGDTLKLRTCDLALQWNGASSGELNLNGALHGEVVEWLDTMAKSNGLDGYVFDLHYSLPSGEIKDDFSFSEVITERCGLLAQYRTYATHACQHLLNNHELQGEVRTWPHHFDTGSYVTLPDSKVGIGFGLAIPDSMSSDYYLYISAYSGHDSLSTEGLDPLTKGEWKNGDWKGGLLPITGLLEQDYMLFFEEAFKAFSQREEQVK